ncbi:MAG: hypothetical protein IJ275_04735 [Ruminococcus sp.]|nr:hypothetical protein [Ruminococcus sp.]
MKKIYTEPDVELINIQLVADVLGPSKYDPSETPLPTHFGGEDDDFE